ncbi:MAG: glycosyltransferase [Anaerolineae bacterium]|nr:glycosyltransferase [Anaerolineae bacterium]
MKLSNRIFGFNLIARKIYQRLKTSPLQAARKAWRILSSPGGFFNGIDIAQNAVRIAHQYELWQQVHRITPTELNVIKQELALLSYRPKISILMPVYNTEDRWLRRAIDSVRQQLYSNWELCIADDASTELHIKDILETYRQVDPRIKIIYRPTNGHISAASNSALTLATGEFVALLDHDDELTAAALAEVIKLLNQHPQADFIYSDEDRLEADGRHSEPFFKPDWSPHLLQSTNYIAHFAVLRRRLVEQIGGFRDEFVGSQDYDLFLRFTEQSDQVYHIPQILYSWRKLPTSTALDLAAKPYAQNATFQALTQAIQRRALPAEVVSGSFPPLFRIRHQIIGAPRVSIIIYASKDNKTISTLKFIRHLRQNSAYQHYEIIIVTEQSHCDELKRTVVHEPIDVVITSTQETSLSKSLSMGAMQAQGEYLLFLGDGIRPINPDWLTAMLEYAQLPGTGCVGAKLLSKRGRLISAGMALGLNDAAGHPGRGISDVPHVILFLNLKDMVREVSAVSALCFMVRGELFNQANGFDLGYEHAFYDVDLCLRLSQLGYRNLFTPFARLTVPADGVNNHFDDNSMVEADKLLLRQKWGTLLNNDPYYNPNFTRNGEDFGLRGYEDHTNTSSGLNN